VKRMLPVTELARDERFNHMSVEEVIFDPRNASPSARINTLAPTYENASENARSLMHSIFVGEIQALEGAGRTCWDFETGDGREDAPFALKLDMARQCWDEARHVEISCKLSEHMGSTIGEFAEQTLLYEAACNPDPVLRLTGVNRALEGLAIDVFKTMRDFGQTLSDPILFVREHIVSLRAAGPAPSPRPDLLDLRLGATIGTVALTLDEPAELFRTGRTRRSTVTTRGTEIWIAPLRRRALLAEASQRRIPVIAEAAGHRLPAASA